MHITGICKKYVKLATLIILDAYSFAKMNMGKCVYFAMYACDETEGEMILLSSQVLWFGIFFMERGPSFVHTVPGVH